MFRVDIHGSADALILKLEGRFAGADAEHTRLLLLRRTAGMNLVVDLTEIEFVDTAGEEVLSFFGRLGAEFIAPTSYTLDVCERLCLRLARAADSPTTARQLARNDGRPFPDEREPREN